MTTLTHTCTQTSHCFTHIKAKAQEPADPLLLRLVHTDVCVSECVCSRLEKVCVILFFFLFNLCGLLKPGVCFSFQHIKKKKQKKNEWAVHHLREFHGFPLVLPEVTVIFNSQKNKTKKPKKNHTAILIIFFLEMKNKSDLFDKTA